MDHGAKQQQTEDMGSLIVLIYMYTTDGESIIHVVHVCARGADPACTLRAPGNTCM